MQEQCPVLVEHTYTTTCHPNPDVREQNMYCHRGSEDLWFYLLWEKDPLGRDIQSPPQWQECHRSYCISQREISSCVSHLCGSNKRKQGSLASFSSVIVYYEANSIKYLLGLGLLITNRGVHHPLKSSTFEGMKQ